MRRYARTAPMTLERALEYCKQLARVGQSFARSSISMPCQIMCNQTPLCCIFAEP